MERNSFLDTVIGAAFPKLQYSRTKYRMAESILRDRERKYDAAAKTRRTDGWESSGVSPNIETLMVLPIIRNRSRELARNNAYMRRGIQAIKNNTVGTGIRPAPASEISNDTEKIKKLWKRWAESTECDWAGLETFYGLQKMIVAAVVQDGECIVRLRRTSDRKAIVPVKLQVCEADLLDDTKQNFSLDNGGWIIQGVEFDKDGKRVAYWLYERPVSESFKLTSTRISVGDVLHIYMQDRPGQVRGVPWAASVMIKMKDYDDFEDAQLMQQKIAACFAAFVTREADDNSNTDPQYENSERVEPGIIEHLHPGEEVSFANPPSTNGQEAFSKKTLMGIASGMGVTYEELSGDYSNVNFSSGRMGWMAMARNVEEWQCRMLIPQFCAPAWDWFVKGAKLRGEIKSEVITAEWTPPRRLMIDPVKETKGMGDMVLNGLDSWQNQVRQMGGEPEVVAAQMAEDMALWDKYSIKVTCDGRYAIKMPVQNPEK